MNTNEAAHNDFSPMRDLMIVERFEKTEKSEGGILLPGQSLESNTVQGRVLKLGPGASDEKTGEIMEIDVREGDVVLFHANSGIKVSGDREKPERYLLREEDILAIVVE